MIYDKVSNLAKYHKFVPVYQKLQTLDLKNLPPGKHDLGNGHFLMIFDTELLADSLLEYHRQYIDIHLPLSVPEKIAFSTLALSKETTPYEAKNDAGLGTLNTKPASIVVSPGEFILFFPEEIHAPKLIATKASKQRRVVVKVQV